MVIDVMYLSASNLKGDENNESQNTSDVATAAMNVNEVSLLLHRFMPYAPCFSMPNLCNARYAFPIIHGDEAMCSGVSRWSAECRRQ